MAKDTEMANERTQIGLYNSSEHAIIAPSWKNLDRKRVLHHFRQSQSFERTDIYLQSCSELQDNEKVIIFWLSKIYGNSLNTIELYARYSVQFLNYACKDFHAITYIDVDAFIKKLQLEGAKAATINTVSATLKSFFKTMVDACFIERNPTSFLKKTKKQREQTLPGHLQHSFSHEEMQTLLAYMHEHAPERDYILVMFLYTTGLRAIEASSLTWNDIIQWQGQWYVDVMGKGAKARRVYIPEKTLTLLMAYRQTNLHIVPYAPPKTLSTMPVFPSLRAKHRHISRHGLYKVIKRWIFEALGKDASPHWMRHTCFTQQRLLGASLESIQAGAGHTSIETTMQYNEAAALMAPAGKVFDLLK